MSGIEYGMPALLILCLARHEALRHGDRGDQEGARDFIRLETAQRTQRQGHLRVLGKRRVTASEDQAQPVVRDLLAVGFVELERSYHTLRGERVPGQLLQLPLQPGLAAEAIDGPVPRRLDDPRPREFRHPGGPPGVQRGDERLLGDLFGQIEVANLTDQGGHDSAPVGAVDLVHHLGGVVRSHDRC